MLALAFVLAAQAGKPFDLVTDPLVTLPAGASTTLQIELRMTEEKKIYKDMVGIDVKDADDLTVGTIVLPEGKTIPDPMGEGPREVYVNGTVLAVPCPPRPMRTAFRSCRSSSISRGAARACATRRWIRR
jgi:hypothetical protein